MIKLNKGKETKKALIISTISGFLVQFVLEDVKLLQSLGYEIHYASNKNNPHYLYDVSILDQLHITFHQMDLTRSPYILGDNLRTYFRLKEIVRGHNIDLIHCHTPVGGLMGRLLGRHFGSKLKVIYTSHGLHYYKGAPLLNNTVLRLVERCLAPYTDVLITINHEDEQNVQKLRLKPGGKVYRIPGVGLDLDKFVPSSEEAKKKEREKLGIPSTALHMVTVGEQNHNKNQIIVLKAIAQMKKKDPYLSERLRYSLYGEGCCKEKLKAMSKKADILDVVCFHPYAQDVPKALTGADVFAFPSIREGLGMSALEALAMGVPVLCYENRGTREFMEHGKNGYVCKQNNIASYCKGIETFFRVTEAHRRKRNEYCRNSVLPYAQEKTTAIMKEIYGKVDESIAGGK